MPSGDEALRLLSEHKRTLSERFGIRDVALFGSTARDEAEEDILRGPQSRSGRRRDWKIHVRDMIGFCEKALDRATGVERADFFADEFRYESALYNIERIGEAVTRVPREIQNANPQIPWRDIIDARNRLVHEYDRINEDAVWATIQSGIPELLPKLRELAGEG